MYVLVQVVQVPELQTNDCSSNAKILLTKSISAFVMLDFFDNNILKVLVWFC